METTKMRIRRLERGVEALRLRIPGLADEDKRALRRCAEKEIAWLRKGRETRIARGPRSQRNPTGGCGGRVITFGPGGDPACTGTECSGNPPSGG
jgi:hypothetical protein